MHEVGFGTEFDMPRTFFERVPRPTVEEVYDLVPPGNGVTKEMYQLGVSGQEEFHKLRSLALSIQGTTGPDQDFLQVFGESLDGYRHELQALLRNEAVIDLALEFERGMVSVDEVIDRLDIPDLDLRNRLAAIVVEGVDPAIQRLFALQGFTGTEGESKARSQTGLLFTYRNHPSQTPMVITGGLEHGLIERLKPQAEAINKGRYLVHVFQVTKLVWQTYFPEFADEPVVKYLEMYDPHHQYREKDNPDCGSNGGWTHSLRRIYLESADDLDQGPILQMYEQKTRSSSDTLMVRKIHDVKTMSHEWAHAVFDHITNDLPGVRVTEADDSLQATFTEGFAVMMEYLTLRVMKENPEQFGLREDDLGDIQRQRERRANRLDGRVGNLASYYGEGFRGVFWPLFQRAYASVRDPQTLGKTMAKVRKYMEALDGEVLQKTSRYSQSLPYRQLVDQGDPAAWLEWVGNQVAVLEETGGHDLA